MKTLTEIRQSYEKIRCVVEDTDWSWEAKFHHAFRIFSSELSGSLPGFDYYDPDTTYQEDVLALKDALSDYLEEHYGVDDD